MNSLAEEYYEDRLKLFPIDATENGDDRYNDQLTIEISPEHLQQQRSTWNRYVARLREIRPETLNAADGLTFAILDYELKQRLAALDYDSPLIPVRQLYSMPLNFAMLGSGVLQPFRNTKDYDDFRKRMARFPDWVDAAIANMRIGIEKHVVQPKIVIEKTVPQLDALIVADLKQSVFFKPLTNWPATIGEGDRQRLTADYTDAIQTVIVPAYRRLRDFLRNEYLPKCRDSVGLSALPKGREWYQFLVQQMTTTRLTPDEIFGLGTREVDRIRAEMEKVRTKEGFQGDLGAFVAHARSAEPSCSTKAALGERYNALREGIETRIPRLFGIIPKVPYAIRPVEEYRENASPTHYMPGTPDGNRPGIFYFNARELARGPMPVSEAIFLHEAVPGHHFQISIAQEQRELPRFRRFALYYAYAEGWGLYAESLGEQLGCYRTAYQQMDRFSSEMWRARRLVVDVGLHWKGWSREQAIRYMEDNPVKLLPPELEVDRYIAFPAQALTYKVGELKIRELRSRAERDLGNRFDQRQFHDAILRDGGMPLDVLEGKLQAWLRQVSHTEATAK